MIESAQTGTAHACAPQEQGLIEAAARGDSLAFRRLVEQRGRSVFQLCWRITRDEALAQDAAQETFCKVWRGLPGFGGRAAFGTWLHRIAVNAALEQLRRNARHADGRADSELFDREEGDPESAQASEAPGPLQRVEGAEIGQRIHRVMQDMSPLERAAFVLRHVHGESLEQLGSVLGLNEGQSKQAIFRAVRKLRAALSEWSTP